MKKNHEKITKDFSPNIDPVRSLAPSGQSYSIVSLSGEHIFPANADANALFMLYITELNDTFPFGHVPHTSYCIAACIYLTHGLLVLHSHAVGPVSLSQPVCA